MNRYALTTSAEADLNKILQFIAARDGTHRALHVYESFVDAFELLVRFPGSGSRRLHLTPDSIRWWPVGRFLVLYESERAPIVILRVIHGGRDLARAILENQ